MKTAWEKVQIARQTQRPKALDYIESIFDNFIEFHGDRNFGDDKAIVGGIALLDELPVTVIGEQKGKSAKENVKRYSPQNIMPQWEMLFHKLTEK